MTLSPVMKVGNHLAGIYISKQLESCVRWTGVHFEMYPACISNALKTRVVRTFREGYLPPRAGHELRTVVAALRCAKTSHVWQPMGEFTDDGFEIWVPRDQHGMACKRILTEAEYLDLDMKMGPLSFTQHTVGEFNLIRIPRTLVHSNFRTASTTEFHKLRPTITNIMLDSIKYREPIIEQLLNNGTFQLRMEEV